ncbi:MAG: M20 family metallopeptidase [Eubacteriales bacterium]|nr:M20 family metallopeptidase [Eubacteriales bacterium]
MMENARLLAQAQALRGDTLRMYRALHRRPETAGREVETNAYIRAELEAIGAPYLAPAPNLTLAVLDSGHPGATVGLRCDTDALPVREETGLSYASEREGVMHACGHDGHIAIGLSAARLLWEHRDEWRGRVKVIFQPAEECALGARQVMQTGLVDDVDAFFAIHLWSPYPTGTFCASPVAVSAAVNMFRVVLRGRGGHGATPEKCADALVAGAALVTDLQAAVARMVSPLAPALLTIGSFHAGAVGNVIADQAEIEGTIRSLDEGVRGTLEDALANMARHIAAAYGCTAEVENRRSCDAVRNDRRAAALAERCAQALFGAERVAPQQTLMLGDDFANYGAIAPYCYAQAGIADAARHTDAPHHSGRFRVDENVLPDCVAWMGAFAMACGETWNAPEK